MKDALELFGIAKTSIARKLNLKGETAIIDMEDMEWSAGDNMVGWGPIDEGGMHQFGLHVSHTVPAGDHMVVTKKREDEDPKNMVFIFKLDKQLKDL